MTTTPTILIPFSSNDFPIDSIDLNQYLSQRISSAIESNLDLTETSYSTQESQVEINSTHNHVDEFSIKPSNPTSTGKLRHYEAFEVLEAIDRRDTMAIFEIRNSNFNLLVEAAPGGSTPLLYAMRLGETHRGIALLLTGMISKQVNTIADLENSQPSAETRNSLRLIRANLRLAISYGLESDENTLVASYLQVIIMSEGIRWLNLASENLFLALQQEGGRSQPVHTAKSLLEKFIAKEGKIHQISAAVGDFYGNSVSDLILLGLWIYISDSLNQKVELPLHYFARDDRIVKTLKERVDMLKRDGRWMKLSKSLRHQIEVTVSILIKKNISWTKKIEELSSRLDN